MLKVQGTEPVVLAKVVDLTSRQDVKDTKKAAIDMNLHAEKQRYVERDAPVRGHDVTDEALDRLNITMRALNTRLKFEKHEASGQYLVRVVDEETNETIREIPPEKVLDMMVHLRKLVGILVDERA